MAVEDGSTAIEPTRSLDSPLPKIPRLSPHVSSSSDSSRPNSQASSRTSRSVSPSPVPKSVPAIDSDDSIELSALPSIPSIPESTSSSQPQRLNVPPRSVSSALATNPRTSDEASWSSRLRHLVPTGICFTNTLGTLSLGLALIGMIFFGRLARWTALKDYTSTCLGILPADKKLGPNCQKIVSQDPVDLPSPPWSHWWKRSWDTTPEAGLMPKLNSVTPVAIMLAFTIIVGGLSLIFFRRYRRTEDVFTSPVRSDWQIRHHQEASEPASGGGYRMIRRNPDDHHPLGQLRNEIRKSQPNAVENPTGEPTWRSHNTSQETLINYWENMIWGKSEVSLTNDTSDEKHENLVELETEGPNKTFFDPETGEFIHLTPWKSTGVEEAHGLKPDGKGSIRRALAMMTLGATGWAGGKSIDDLLAEELQANSKGKEKEPDEPQAGDCITGDMINQSPSGKHRTA